MSFWNRIGNLLKNVGEKIKSAAIWARDRVQDAARWIWNAPATQWVVSKAKFLASRAWKFAQAPIGMSAIGLGTAITFMPSLVTLIPLAFVGLGGYLIWKALRRATISETTQREINELNEVAIPDETLSDRYAELDQRLVAASNKQDSVLISDITGRMFLIKVRAGDHSKLKKDATTSVIHGECRRENEDQLISNVPGFKWDWTRMYNAIRAEDSRLKDVAKAKAKIKAEKPSQSVAA